MKGKIISKEEYNAILYPPITEEQLSIVANVVGYVGENYNPLVDDTQAHTIAKYLLLREDIEMFADDGQFFIYKWHFDTTVDKEILSHSDQYARALVDAVLVLDDNST